MKKAVQSAMRLGAKGVKVVCSGRLGGAKLQELKNIMKEAPRIL